MSCVQSTSTVIPSVIVNLSAIYSTCCERHCALFHSWARLYSARPTPRNLCEIWQSPPEIRGGAYLPLVNSESRRAGCGVTGVRRTPSPRSRLSPPPLSPASEGIHLTSRTANTYNHPVLVWCWSNVCDAVPVSKQHWVGVSWMKEHSANTKHWPNSILKLDQRRRRWHTIETILVGLMSLLGGEGG